MDNLTKNPGLQHVAEEILLNLKIVTLDKCLKVNESWKNIINTPSFWLRKCLRGGKLMKSKSAWEKVIQVMSHTNREKNIIFHHLENIYRYGFGFLSPIVWATENGYAEVIKVFTPKFIKDSLNEDWNPYEDNLIYRAAEKGHTDVIKELLPSFANNPNAPNKLGRTPIDEAGKYGHTEIIKLLAPLVDNPNAPDRNGRTPMHEAAINGHERFIKVLINYFIDDFNPPDSTGKTPIYLAAKMGHANLTQILALLTNNPNAPNQFGMTPIHVAALEDKVDVIKILIPLVDNPNATNQIGRTPIHAAAMKGNIDFIKILAPLVDGNPNMPDLPGMTPIQLTCHHVASFEIYKEIKKYLELRTFLC